MKKTFLILGAAVLVLGVGLFVVNIVLSNKAAEELVRRIAPKLQEMGITYSDLSVNAFGGNLTMNDLQSEDLSVELITLGVDITDLIALMEDPNNTLNSLDLDVFHFRAGDNNGREGIDIGEGSVSIEGVLDVREFVRNPEAFMESLIEQEDVDVSISGNDITVRARELKRELGLPSETMVLKSAMFDVDKDGDSFDVRMMADAPMAGQMDIIAQGEDGALTLLKGDMSIVGIETDDVLLSMGNCSFEIDATIAIDRNDLDMLLPELLAGKEDFSYSMKGSEIVVGGRGGREMAEEFGLDTPGLNVENYACDASFNGEEFEMELEVYSNAGNIEADIDMTAEDYDNIDDLENIHFHKIEIELSDLVPALSHQVRAAGAAFMEPDGDDGFRFSYKGSVEGLKNFDF